MGRSRILPVLLLILSVVASYGQSTLNASISSLLEKREFGKAREILSPVTSTNPQYAEAQYFLGRIAVEERKYELSIEKFEQAIQANPGVAEYHNWLGVMYGVIAMSSHPLRQAYLAPKIRNEFETAAQLEPNNLQTQWGLITYYVKAPGFLGGSWEKAFASAKVIGSLNRAQGVRALACIHAGQKKNAVAEKEFIQAMQMEPDDTGHLIALGEFYSVLGQYRKAFELYDAFLTSHPLFKVAAYHMGHVSTMSGYNMEKGIRAFSEYLRYTPGMNEPALAEAHLGLALLYEKTGDKANALKSFEACLALDPELKEAKAGLERLN